MKTKKSIASKIVLEKKFMGVYVDNDVLSFFERQSDGYKEAFFKIMNDTLRMEFFNQFPSDGSTVFFPHTVERIGGGFCFPLVDFNPDNSPF